MDYHHHAVLTVSGREYLAKNVVEGRLSLREAAAACRLSRQTAAKWVRRYRLESVAGLKDRFCRSSHSPRRTPDEFVAKVESLRRQRWTGIRIALELKIGPATVSRILRRLQLNRIRDLEPSANTALIDGVRRFAMDVRELDIDLIDRINPFGEAYAILAKTMSEESLKQVAVAISAKRTNLTPDEAKDLAVRAFRFKKERGRLPALDSQDAWEKRMAEGAAAFMRYKKEGRYE